MGHLAAVLEKQDVGAQIKSFLAEHLLRIVIFIICSIQLYEFLLYRVSVHKLCICR
jgi:hypothetical protein